MRILALALLTLLAGCVAPVKPEPAAVTEPATRLVPTNKGNFVCLAPGYEQSEQWEAACAPIGPFRRCVESTTQLQCGSEGRPA